MQAEEFFRRMWELKPIAVNVMGFHDLSETDHPKITPLDRSLFEAQTYANGVILARELSALLDELKPRERKDED